MDLHLHTPASADYKQSEISYLDFLKRAEEKNLDIIAFADHNTISGYASYLDEVESLEMLEERKQLRGDEPKRLAEYRRLREKILILPGFEFTATLGFHILGIFPPDATVRQLEHLLLSLRVPGDKLDEGSGQVGATVDVLTAYRLINEAGGLVIAAHANSSHGVAMVGSDFGGQTRIAYTQDPNLHALELTDLDSRSRRRMATFFNGTKSDYPRKMHSIQGSDAHRLIYDPKFKNEMGLGDRVTEIMLDEVSFDAIKQVFLGTDYARTRPARGAAIVTEETADPLRPAREQGSTLVQSFHEHFKDKRGIAPGILEDIAAMANTNGGTVYIGVPANAKAAVAGVDRAESAIVELRAAIAKLIQPSFDAHLETVKSQGKTVIRVMVPRGTSTPYTFDSTQILVRADNKSRAATRDEIMQLVRESLAVESTATAALLEPRLVEETPAEIVPQVEPPRNGVEIIATEIRRNMQYHSVRDLRNRRVVHNVTRSSARHLWQYAVDEYEKNPVVPERVQWRGDLGIWKAYTHAGKARHDFVQRANGKLFVYYGVTEDGLHGPWRDLIAPSGEPTALMPAPPTAMTAVEPQPSDLAIQDAVQESFASLTPSRVAEPVEATPQPEPDDVAPEPEPASMPEPETLAPQPALDLEPEPQALAPEPEPEPAPAPKRAPEPPAAVQEPPAPEPAPPAPAPAPKTRAQEWRELLDRAIEDARAAQQAAKKKEGPSEPEPKPDD